ncbi:MAG: pyridoxal-phosphate dependent enzyme, partial [Chloroflexi bacterium]|nr:pyridoxal-phosphate dependent enzyme [Chloroflexota bacterium]
MSHLSPSVVAKAAKRLAGIANKTPVFTSRALNERAGCEIFLKCENFQRVGAFKFRGAYNAISQLSAAQKAAGVITHSSGNHAQGVALAAKLLGVQAIIVMPEDAPAIKREATAGYGAEIISCPAIDREKVSAEQISQHNYTLIHPYDNDQVIAGAGTAAWELFAEIGPLDALFVPVGGGGLISGSALATAAQSPGCRVVGVEPELGADANRSWREGQVITLDHVPDTIADGLRTRFIGDRNLAVMRQYVTDMTAVSEEAILETLQFLWSRLKIVVEPSSAVALAPLFTGQYPAAGQRVGVILSGGNVDILNWKPEIREQKLGAESLSANLQSPISKTQSQPERPRVLVSANMDKAGLEILRQAADVTVAPQLERETFLQEISAYQALVVGPQQHITDQMLEYGFNLRAIGNLSSYLDNIDVSTARDVGIAVCNAPDSSAITIAEHTLTRLLFLATRFGDGRLAGKTLGLVGFGHVGQQVAKRARAFDMNIIVNQPRLTPELALSAGVEVADLANLLPQADFVSLHVPYKAETHLFIGPKNLGKMKPTACLINTGHTDLLNEAALLDALENGRIAGAALSQLPKDVASDSLNASVAKQVRRCSKVIVSPHVSTILRQQKKDIAIVVAKQIIEILQRKQANETLALELVPAEQVVPHEQIDDKRVARLMSRLEEDGRLVNPPVTTFWDGKYIVLDGATRSTAFKRLGYKYTIVQVAQAEREGFELHTWYHAISSLQPFADLYERLKTIDGLILTPLPDDRVRAAFRQKDALCY